MTTNVTYSKGPWFFREDEGERTIYAKDEDGREFVVCDVFDTSEGLEGDCPQARANAALIRMVPELVDALREAEAGLEFAGADREIPEGDFVPSPTLALRNIRAMLAKAPPSPEVEVEQDF
jgi:hypothetical protein